MRFFKFAYDQSRNGLGKSFLFAMLLGFIFALSILVIMLKTFSTFNNEELTKIAEETGCQIISYELVCNVDYYAKDGFMIDVNNNHNHNGYELVLTKDGFITSSGVTPYKTMLESFSLSNGNLTVNDINNFVSAMSLFLYVFAFIFAFIGASIYFFIANAILAAFMRLFINSKMGTSFQYDEMFKITMIVVAPYVLFNAITRMIIDTSLVGFITGFIPLIGWLLHIVIDYVIIFGLVYLAVKEGRDTESATIKALEGYSVEE